MTYGFRDREAFDRIVGWELEQITLDKYHIMFWFQQERALLNVASAFSHRSTQFGFEYTYEIYGEKRTFRGDQLLREKIIEVSVRSRDRLDLLFSNDDVLTVHDDPEFRSWWFIEWDEPAAFPAVRHQIWMIEDHD